jgi:dTDP-4-dehydrorhamnose reductase
MRVAVIGATGQLGTDVVRRFDAAGHEVISLGHADVDVADEPAVREALLALRAAVVVSTAAMHQVDRCEEEPAAAFRVNALGARNVARACAEAGSAVVYVSTDYVFDGMSRTPYREHDLAHPVNAYGVTKLAGEMFVSAECPRSFVVRTSALYGTNPCRGKGGLNFVRLMLRLATERPEIRVVTDEVVCPTYTLQLADAIVKLAGTDSYGTYHAVSRDSCSWYEFADAIFRRTGTHANLIPATSQEFPKKTRRPAYSALDTSRIHKIGVDALTSWDDALGQYLSAVA